MNYSGWSIDESKRGRKCSVCKIKIDKGFKVISVWRRSVQVSVCAKCCYLMFNAIMEHYNIDEIQQQVLEENL